MIYRDNIDPFIRKMYRLLETKPEIFKIKDLGKKTAGHCLDDGSEIALHYKHDIISTLIHEVIHYLHPDWSEKTVLAAEKYIINHISPRRAANIVKKLSQAL